MFLATLLRKTFSASPMVNEVALRRRAASAFPELGYARLTTEMLRDIARDEGADFAAALFFDRIRRSPEHGVFIAELEALDPCLASLPRLAGKLLVAPAAFYREYPELGGDGAIVRDVAREFGLEAQVIPVRSVGSVTENAQVIAGCLAAEPDRSVILASLSKGGADVRVALEANPALARKIRVWLQICGLVRGSPILDELLANPWWQRTVLRVWLARIGADMRLASELAHAPGSLLAGPAAAPPDLPVINIIGVPLSSHVTGSVRERYLRMAPLGPNDGSTLLRDAIIEPGLVYPVWGADHYFRVPAVSLLLYRLFLYLAGKDAPTRPSEFCH